MTNENADALMLQGEFTAPFELYVLVAWVNAFLRFLSWGYCGCRFVVVDVELSDKGNNQITFIDFCSPYFFRAIHKGPSLFPLGDTDSRECSLI